STGNDLEKMRANMGYAAWLRDFLANHTPHETERVVYRNLLEQQDGLMRQRRQYTMALSMRSHPLGRFWMWYRHRRAFGIRLRALVVAGIKARSLADRLSKNSRPMDSIFNPADNAENQYIRILVDELRTRGYRIHPLDTLFSGYRHFRSVKLVHLNWFENIDDSNLFTVLRSFFRKLVVLVAIRLSGKALVWT